MFNKAIKGDYKYLYKKRIQIILLTVLYFGISLGLFFLGYFTTGTKKNLLTVVAVLGCLPACKSMVSMVMYIMAKGCSEKTHELIEDCKTDLLIMYDMYFTSYDNNYAISAMVVYNQLVIGYTEDAACDTKKAEEHIKVMLNKSSNQVGQVTFTKDIKKFLGMINNIINNQDEVNNEKDEAIRIALYEICL